MRSHRGDAPIIPVVVQWRPPTEESPGTWHKEGSAFLVDGPSFRDWIASLSAEDFNVDATTSGWEALVSHVGPRDRHVESTDGPAQRTIGQLFWLIVQPLGVALVALYCAGTTAKVLRPTEALVAIGTLGLLGLLAARVPRLKKLGLIWAGSIIIAYAIALFVILVRHLH